MPLPPIATPACQQINNSLHPSVGPQEDCSLELDRMRRIVTKRYVKQHAKMKGENECPGRNAGENPSHRRKLNRSDRGCAKKYTNTSSLFGRSGVMGGGGGDNSLYCPRGTFIYLGFYAHVCTYVRLTGLNTRTTHIKKSMYMRSTKISALLSTHNKYNLPSFSRTYPVSSICSSNRQTDREAERERGNRTAWLRSC